MNGSDNDIREALLYTNNDERAREEDAFGSPRQLFSSSTNSNGLVEHEHAVVANMGESDPDHVEREQSRIVLKVLGEPYAASLRFWFQQLPLAMLTGILVGIASLLFLGSIHFVMGLWLGDTSKHKDEIFTILVHGGGWKWIVIAVGGTAVSACMLLLPGAPSVGTTRTMFHDAFDLQGRPRDTLYLVMSCFACLACGAPLGPEMAIGAMGSAIATVLFQTLVHPKETSVESETMRAMLVASGLAASLGGLFPSPILGVTIVHELSVAARTRHGTSIRALVASQQGYEGSSDDESSLFSSSEPLSTHEEEKDHDFMEQITTTGTAATLAFVTVRLVMSVLPLLHTPYTSHTSIKLPQEDFRLWHLALAIPLGVACGVLGSVVLIVNGACRSIRQETCRALSRFGGAWVGRLVFPMLAGALYGVTSASNPLIVGTGMQLIHQVLEQHFDDEQDLISPKLLIQTALVKSMTMALCLGFGLVGGPVFPLVFVGMCLGLSASILCGLPLIVTIPCCMCAAAGSFVVIPITLVVFVSMVFSLSPEQMGPPFVATFCAYSVVGGFGIVKRLGLKRLGGGTRQENEELDQRYEELSSPNNGGDDDDDVLRSVRKSIFGTT